MSTHLKNDLTALALSAMENLKAIYVGKKLITYGLTVFKSPTSKCDFVYNNAYNLDERGNFEGDKESIWSSCKLKIEYTNRVILKLRIKKSTNLLI